jgi:hypothetical protein
MAGSTGFGWPCTPTPNVQDRQDWARLGSSSEESGLDLGVQVRWLVSCIFLYRADSSDEADLIHPGRCEYATGGQPLRMHSGYIVAGNIRGLSGGLTSCSFAVWILAAHLVMDQCAASVLFSSFWSWMKRDKRRAGVPGHLVSRIRLISTQNENIELIW